jgi:hypothetical protein
MKRPIDLRQAIAALTILLGLGTLGAGCAQDEEAISADTTCKEYLSRPGEERYDAAIRVSSEVEGVSNPGNPMWALSLDGACGSAPSMTLGEYFDPSR